MSNYKRINANVIQMGTQQKKCTIISGSPNNDININANITD